LRENDFNLLISIINIMGWLSLALGTDVAFFPQQEILLAVKQKEINDGCYRSCYS
jgi:hypothetical protein